MKTIYKSKDGKTAVLKLYDSQLEKLGCGYQDRYVATSFGQTHLVETGNLEGPPLLVFHGGNSTTAYHLLLCRFLLKDFHVYAVDIIGHPGKSAEVSLSPYGCDYGKWTNEVVSGLGFNQIRCFGGSFGGGVLAKFMCVAPEKIVKSVLVVPSGINNAFPIGSAKMMLPLLQYVSTKDDKYITRAALYMAITREVLDTDTLDTVKNSFQYVKTKIGMPSNVSGKKMRRCTAPVLVMAGEYDCLFPAKKVLKRAEKILPDSTLYELKGRGHMHVLTEEEKSRIVQFLK
ncbi:alpha/beta hydrolase [Clostridium sp. D33t1_170424_F3]|uniref:alpha/beta fold hydrolase n=1 Tax=Clostridium sp. D33t1_170424_F3 TaxID=2787099 RepID=UPI002570112D|nr:alpha/beta hydrolase [Clostridium sp. D33t1_170424_F3]